MSLIFPASPKTIKQAAENLKAGGLVAFPTETVYGLGADAHQKHAVEKIFKAKNRPSNNPLILHVLNKKMAEKYVDFNGWADILSSIFWAGPLTFILNKKQSCDLPDIISAGRKTIAVRMPSHPTALALLKALGRPLVAPSANRSGALSPTTPLHVQESLGDAAEMILAGGKCKVGLESTLIDLTGEMPILLRHGAVSAMEIADALGQNIDVKAGVRVSSETETCLSPGQFLKHYAPKKSIRLKAVDLEEGEGLLAFGRTQFMGKKSGGTLEDLPQDWVQNLSPLGDLQEAAQNLFSALHYLDQTNCKRIAIMDIPNQGIGQAINDRLSRAAENS